MSQTNKPYEDPKKNPNGCEENQNSTHRVRGREDMRVAGNTFVIPGKVLDPPEPIKHPRKPRPTPESQS